MNDFSLTGLSDRDAVLAQLRDARFAHGLHCPRCRATNVHRWGSFSGRQRYRCNACARTFSDLTATPAAYSKKIELWPTYGRFLNAGLTVRRAAELISIHPCTAFRWRHALLGEMRCRDRERLTGWVELHTLWFALSEKGRRNLDRPARAHGVRSRWCSPVIGQNVVLACDRDGHVISTPFDVLKPASRLWSRGSLVNALVDRVDGQPLVTMKRGKFSAGGILAVRLRGRFYHTRYRSTRNPLTLIHVRTVRSYSLRLRVWLTRFRGVATRYLANYLVWHREFDRMHRNCMQVSVLRWPVDRESG